MKLFAAFALAVVPALAGLPSSKATVIADPAFSVTMPSHPDKKASTVEAAAGSGSELRYSSEKDGVAFLFDYIEYSFAPDPDYAALRDAFVEALGGGSITGQHDLTLDGHAGYTFTVATADFLVIHKMFLCGNRLYQLAVAVPAGKPVPPEAAAFLDSLKLAADPQI